MVMMVRGLLLPSFYYLKFSGSEGIFPYITTMINTSVIFDFLKYCLGAKGDMSKVVAGMDWRLLYEFASKQAMLGVCFDGIERLGNEYSEELKKNPIERNLLMTWMGAAQQIRRQNMKVNVVAGKLYSMLRENGLRCCILKGQGNALMYPNPYSRNPGDIDVWVNASRERITEYAKKHFKIEDDIRYHHLETSLDGVPVELHFFPGIMNNPVYNARLQKWFKRNADLQCSNVLELPDGVGEMAVPTTAFNVIYQLTHLYHHFFDEGIGMRQIVDYYFVINSFALEKDFLEKSFSKIMPSLLSIKEGPSKITPSLFTIKEPFSKTHPSSLTLKRGLSKITPSLFTIKEGSTSSPSPSSSEGGDVKRSSCRSEPLRSKVGGASEPSPDFSLTQQSCECLTAGALEPSSESLTAGALKGASEPSLDFSLTQQSCDSGMLRYLGLWRFAGAVMYVLHEVLGLPDEKMIAPMDEKRGKLLLSEIMNGGNFGRHFTKYGHFTQQGMVKKYFLKIWRNMHFVRCYPEEALSEPVFRTWHFFWRIWARG
ncbi:nucleotidyltransferase family protein [uncultured Prevotella sp.]|uniref:nucleotidyltransferase family protein n=1 Tax=uncultured Prevotella sp. TaxID=159272 RepID=UPI0026193D96|nr:nucleotidyltransferase family protein [uncultured Prevotella sp.]